MLWRLLLLLLMAVSTGLAEVDVGTKRADVLLELGRPTSTLMRGGREIMIFPDGVRVELEKGVVVATKGLAAKAVAAEAAPPAADQPVATEAAPADEAAEKPLTPAEIAAEEKAEREYAEQQAKARLEMEKAITDMEEAGKNPPMLEAPAFNALRVILEFAMRWLFMLVVLKVASKYWDSEISWKGLAIAAAADVGTRTVCYTAGTIILGMPSLFYADEAVATIVLVVVLRKVSFNRSFAKAVEIALSVKVFSTMVGALLFTFVLNFLF